MKLLRALFYQYYWWQKRKENDESFAHALAVLCLLVPLFGIVGFIAIFADVTGLVILQKYDIKMVIFTMFILGLAVSWWLFLRRKQYKTIAQEHDIYDKTMQDDAFPDVYLLPGDNLEEAYLYGLVSVNERGAADTGAVEKAAMAATYGDKLLGYPLSFNTCVFICQPDYFGTVPESLQSIIDYSNENEPGEDVEYLLEWDVNDAFYDFPFIGNSVTSEKNETDTMNVIYDEELYQQDLEYFDTILASFSVDAGQVSEARIIENFLAGRTLSAIIDTDSLYKLEGHPYELMKMPDLNETLPAATCAMTDMLIVNDYTGQPDAAAEFAQFVTGTMAGDLYDLSGHFSVIPSGQPTEAERIAFDAYETSVLVPDSKDARDFWVSVQTTILKYFD